MRTDLEMLAHDSMMGRGSGTEDEHQAALFLLARFQEYGLEPPPGGGLQPFEA